MPKKGRAGKPREPKAARTARARAPAPAAPAKERDDRGKRLLDLVVMLLGARAPVPYREIRAQFRAYRTENEEAGLRAFERDKAELLDLGVPLRYVTADEDDSVDDSGYLVDLRRYRLPEIHLTADEVAALVLAGSVARAAPGTTYAEVVDLALKKLAFDLPAAPDTPGRPVEAGAGQVLVHFPRPARAAALADRLAHLEQATRDRKRVTLRYVSAAHGETATRDVDPYGLIYRQGAWLLVAHCHLRKGVRSFRLDRMVEVAVAPKPKSPDFERPADFDVRRFADRSPWTFEVAPPVDVEIDVHPPAATVANEDFGEGALRETLAGGATRIRFRCANPDYLVYRVLAAKGAMTVRSPAELRRRLRAELDAILARYPAPAAKPAAAPEEAAAPKVLQP